jgi:hypothetical protein
LGCQSEGEKEECDLRLWVVTLKNLKADFLTLVVKPRTIESLQVGFFDVVERVGTMHFYIHFTTSNSKRRGEVPPESNS